MKKQPDKVIILSTPTAKGVTQFEKRFLGRDDEYSDWTDWSKQKKRSVNKKADIIYGICVMAIFGCLYVLFLMAWSCQVPINY